uniref:Uncharacterized protein n=1 Tax=Timema tahoe TaxID=61484 RepID=A0A7R9IR72_9NEOP|nr:unnamed protein product [Timema tahoe]
MASPEIRLYCVQNPHKEPGVIRHKRYLAVAGLRVQNYSKLWENCNSNKARVAAMLALLTKNGLSGRPTIDKCVQLRKRRETKQEIQELDLDNILQSGRGGRRTRGAAQSPPERVTFEPSDESAEEDKKHRFARIKAMADSDSD